MEKRKGINHLEKLGVFLRKCCQWERPVFILEQETGRYFREHWVLGLKILLKKKRALHSFSFIFMRPITPRQESLVPLFCEKFQILSCYRHFIMVTKTSPWKEIPELKSHGGTVPLQPIIVRDLALINSGLRRKINPSPGRGGPWYVVPMPEFELVLRWDLSWIWVLNWVLLFERGWVLIRELEKELWVESLDVPSNVEAASFSGAETNTKNFFSCFM